MAMVSYILSGIATVLGMIEPFSKKMRTVLVFNFVGNLLVSVSYFLVGGISGALICFVACCQVIINYSFNEKNKKIPYWLIGIYLVVFLAVNILGYKNVYDLFALAASVCFVLSMVQIKAGYYRILYVVNSMLWIVYDIFAQAYGNLFTHTFLFVAISMAIYIRDVRKHKER